MSDKKNIDKLFKEQFQNFEATPSPQVWNNIQATLKKEKDDRKVIPLWWKVAGVAAVLALLLTVGNMYWNSSGTVTEDSMVDEKTDVTVPADNTDPALKNEISTEVASDATPDSEKDKENGLEDKSSPNNILLKESQESHKALATEDNNELKSNKAENPLKKQAEVVDRNQIDAIVTETNTKKDLGNQQLKNPTIVNNASEANNTTIALEENPTRQPSEKGNDPFLNKDVSTPKETGIAAQTNNAEKQDANQVSKDVNPLIKNATPSTNSKVNEAITSETKVDAENTEENKKSIFDAIAETETVEESTKEDKKDKDLRNWEVTPNFGPVFYSSLDGGSSIDPMFTDNAQNTETNFSYGVQVSYAVNDRLSIRSGVSNVNLGYSTGDIDLATGPVSAALTSIDYGERTNVLTAVDKGALETSDSANPFENLTPKNTGGNAEITQNLSYYEVPLELNYALVDNRFGIHMIGGFSTLFLGDNEVVANDGAFEQVIGEANNLNSVSFSTNIGLGFNYKISKRLKFNIEPMFKYQLNPYTDSSVDFKPYYLGVYSGLSFKF